MLTAENQLDRPVRWVHVSEIDQIAHLLAGRELIMSTGMPLTRTPAAAASYIAALDQAGATALVVELSSHLPAIPDAALDEARRRGFPVITLAETVRFVEITEEIHRGSLPTSSATWSSPGWFIRDSPSSAWKAQHRARS